MWPFSRKNPGKVATNAQNSESLLTTGLTIEELAQRMFGRDSTSGITITTSTLLKTSVALCCVRVIAEGISQLPLDLIREDSDGKRKKARDRKLYKVLHSQPNEFQTSFEWREQMMYHLATCWNAYSVINWGAGGEVIELLPVVPKSVRVEMSSDWELVYWITAYDGTQLQVSPQNMLHLKGPSWNGWEGMDFMTLAANVLGLTVATENTHAELHKNGARPGGILAVEGELSEPAKVKLKKSWNAAFGGDSRFGTAVLDGSVKWIPLMMNGVDAEHLDTRKFQLEEVCRMFRVFPQMVMHSDKTSTYASAEQFFNAHVVHCLGPWITRLEQAFDAKLVKGRGLYTKFNTYGMLRGDSKAQAEFFRTGVANGYLMRNEVRELLDLDPKEGLDTPLIPSGMIEKGKEDEADGRGAGGDDPEEPDSKEAGKQGKGQWGI